MSSRPETIVSSAVPPSAPTGEALVGQRIQKYEIVRILGHGGMGTVYEALNTAISKRVAMKFIDAEAAQNKDAVARFQREAEAASAVESAHIVEIFDSGYTDEGLPFIVMELLRGEDLGHRIKRCGRLDLPEAVHVAAQILRGLNRAHQAGIVHRDLKPDNIFLVDRDDDTSFAKILDFGISKVHRGEGPPVNTLTRQGTVLGTPFYMSPEQAQALPDIDGRTDIWSIGAILYECLTGRPPYNGKSYEQVIVNICMHDADDVRLHNPGVPEGVAQVIARALSRDRAARFATAREFLDALKAATGSLISSRSGPLPREDSSPNAADPGVLPSSSSSTKVARQASSSTPTGDADGAMEPTLEVNPAGTSKVGWSTSRRDAARRREKRTVLMVVVPALLAGGLGAFVFTRTRPSASADSSPSTNSSLISPNADVVVQVKASVAGGRVLVDGAEVPGGMLKGHKGDVKKVRIEATGYAPSEIEVRLEPEGEPVQVDLLPETGEKSPVVAPASDAAIPVSAVPTAAQVALKGRQDGKGRQGARGTDPAPTKASATATPAALPPPTASPLAVTAAPKATGIGGELKLKTD